MRTPATTHDEATCHACGQIALRRTSGAYLDPNATAAPVARMGDTTVRRVSDRDHLRFMVRLEVLDLVANLERRAFPTHEPLHLSPVEDLRR